MSPEVAASSRMPTHPALGVYTDVDSLAAVESVATSRSTPILVRDSEMARRRRSPRIGTGNESFLVADDESWRGGYATEARPTLVSDRDSLFSTPLDSWADAYVNSSGAGAVLTPSRFIPNAGWAALASLVTELAAIESTNAIPFVPAPAAMIDQASLDRFLQELRPMRGRRVAFLFAGGRESLSSKSRLLAVRRVLSVHPGAWMVGVDPLVASDAIAHGADMAFVGVRSGLRWPSQPGASNGGFNARDFVPGIFNRELLSFRSPSVFADWYVNALSPVCAVCGRAVDRYSASDADKQAILVHNVHASVDFAIELLNQPEAARAGWLNSERIAAFVAHSWLSRTGASSLQADRTLRNLCEIDDPTARSTTPVGSWT